MLAPTSAAKQLNSHAHSPLVPRCKIERIASLALATAGAARAEARQQAPASAAGCGRRGRRGGHLARAHATPVLCAVYSVQLLHLGLGVAGIALFVKQCMARAGAQQQVVRCYRCRPALAQRWDGARGPQPTRRTLSCSNEGRTSGLRCQQSRMMSASGGGVFCGMGGRSPFCTTATAACSGVMSLYGMRPCEGRGRGMGVDWGLLADFRQAERHGSGRSPAARRCGGGAQPPLTVSSSQSTTPNE